MDHLAAGGSNGGMDLLNLVRDWPAPVTTAAAVGAALTGGVFFAFSSFVMSGLAQAPGAVGLQAMQAINVAAPSPAFMLLLFGSGALAIPVAIRALTDLSRPGAGLAAAGALAALVTPVMTIAFHVPRNNALAAVAASDPGALEAWAHYVQVWTTGNHVRTLSSAAAGLLLTLALRAGWA